MKNPILKPERFSGHKLVDHLIANPDARGNFKWHTLRSCMWTRLLVQCPQFASWCDFGKITRSDAKKILFAQWNLVSGFKKELLTLRDWAELIVVHPELADHCDLNRIRGDGWKMILAKHPELISRCPLEKFSTYDWRSVLPVYPKLADCCPWENFSGFEWSLLLQDKSVFADRCPWSKFNYSNWFHLLRQKPLFMANFTLDMYPDPNADVPEQEWTITMVKDGAHASYSRVAVLTWFSLNEDGTYGREITKENSASLTLVTNTATSH